jgi:enamine deaminase RidA (YjgF/YER057c/UK114 family)
MAGNQRELVSTGSTFERAAGYSRAVIQDTPAGRWVFVSGTTGYDYSTMTLPDSIDEQTRNCLATIDKALADADCSFEHVVRVHYYISDRSFKETVFPLVGEVFGDVRPAATMVVCGLVEGAMKIEIEVTALKVC